MIHDSDGFNQWEAGQTYALRTINKILDEKCIPPKAFLESYGQILENALKPDSDPDLAARALTLPEVSYIGQHRENVDPPTIYKIRHDLIAAIRGEYGDLIQKIYGANMPVNEFSLSGEAMARRALRNVALRLLDDPHLAKAQYDAADNMTARVGALRVLADKDGALGQAAFDDFYDRFKEHALVVDKWFSIQAMAARDDIMNVLEKLRRHLDFNIKNPNRARSLFSSFAHSNPAGFHMADGSGYRFLTEAVIELNGVNPQIAARLLTPLREWRRYTSDRQEKMKQALQKILDTPKLSPDVFEIASKSLRN